MFKFCQWIDHGHDYEILSHNSVNPSGLEKWEVKGSMPDTLAMQLVGYTKTVQVCKKCGKVNTILTIGV